MDSVLKHGLVLVTEGRHQTKVGFYGDDVDGAMEDETAALVTFPYENKFTEELINPAFLKNLEEHVVSNQSSLYASLVTHEEETVARRNALKTML
jgi:hypothetical protein